MTSHQQGEDVPLFRRHGAKGLEEDLVRLTHVHSCHWVATTQAEQPGQDLAAGAQEREWMDARRLHTVLPFIVQSLISYSYSNSSFYVVDRFPNPCGKVAICNLVGVTSPPFSIVGSVLSVYTRIAGNQTCISKRFRVVKPRKDKCQPDTNRFSSWHSRKCICSDSHCIYLSHRSATAPFRAVILPTCVLCRKVMRCLQLTNSIKVIFSAVFASWSAMYCTR